MFPDGRIVFAKLNQGTDAKGADSRTDWFIAEKDGSETRASWFRFPARLGKCGLHRTASEFSSEEDHDRRTEDT